MKDSRDVKSMDETGSAVAARRRARTRPEKAAPAGNAERVFSNAEARQMLVALNALKHGDASVRLPVEWSGIQGKLAETFDEVVDLNERITQELGRLRQKVGKEGKLKQRAEVSDARGFWREKITHVNELIDDLRSEEHTSELQSPCNLV